MAKKRTKCGDPAGEDMNGRRLSVCGRVEISPHYDLWMRGARTGWIHSYDPQSEVAIVRMDHPRVRRLQRMRPETLKRER